VLRLDPHVDALVAPDAKLETLYKRNTVFDGPVWVRNGAVGYLIFSDLAAGVIDKLNPDGSVSVFTKNIFTGNPSQAYQSSGQPGQKRFRILGADGIALDRFGRVVYCAYSNGEIVRLEKNGRRTVLTSHFAGMRLNAPNDLVYKSDGSLYFTDSRASTSRPDRTRVPHEGLYVLRAGKVALLNASIDHPNGVAFSPDENHLYVTNTRQKNILRFDISDGRITNETVFVDMSGVDGVGAPDGIKVDKRGDVYSTGPRGVWIVSPAGKHIGTILTPRRVRNLAFGGQHFKTLYMTALGALYCVRLRVAGGNLRARTRTLHRPAENLLKRPGAQGL
jgi:gluconolactonase